MTCSTVLYISGGEGHWVLSPGSVSDLKETSCIDSGIALSGNPKKKKIGVFKTRDQMLSNTVRFFSVGIPEFFSLGH